MLPVFRRFNQQDVPTAPNWINNIFNPLNVFCEQTVQTLNKNLTFGTNVQGQKYSVTVTTSGTYTTLNTFSTISLQYTGGGSPTCCIIGSISRDDGTLITSPVTVTGWSFNNNRAPAQIVITYIAGLADSTKYNINLVVL